MSDQYDLRRVSAERDELRAQLARSEEMGVVESRALEELTILCTKLEDENIAMRAAIEAVEVARCPFCHGEYVEEVDGLQHTSDCRFRVVLGRTTSAPAPTPVIAPDGGIDVKCPRCVRVGVVHVAAGERIGHCAQCWLGEGVHVPFVTCAPTPEVKP